MTSPGLNIRHNILLLFSRPNASDRQPPAMMNGTVTTCSNRDGLIYSPLAGVSRCTLTHLLPSPRAPRCCGPRSVSEIMDGRPEGR